MMNFSAITMPALMLRMAVICGAFSTTLFVMESWRWLDWTDKE